MNTTLIVLLCTGKVAQFVLFILHQLLFTGRIHVDWNFHISGSFPSAYVVVSVGKDTKIRGHCPKLADDTIPSNNGTIFRCHLNTTPSRERAGPNGAQTSFVCFHRQSGDSSIKRLIINTVFQCLLSCY